MPKILLATFLYEPEIGGGAAQVVQILAHAAALRGYQVHILTSAPDQHFSCQANGQITIYRLPTRNLYWVADKDHQPTWKKVIWQLVDTWNPFVYQSTKILLKQIQPDIIHVHKLRGLSPAVWSAAASSCDAPILHTCHDFELISPQGTLYGHVGDMALNRSYWLRPYQKIRALASRQIRFATAPSTFTLDLHKLNGFFQKAKTLVIPNTHGVSLSDIENRIKSHDRSGKENGLNFLYLGRLELDKGIQTLCEAFSNVFSPTDHVRLDIVGEGYLRKDLQERYRNHKNIQFHGALYGESKNRLIAHCDVVVVPSHAQETFGIVIAEAYSYGKPVLAANIGGIPEIILPEKTGWLIFPRSASSLSEALIQISKSTDLINQMKDACFETAKRFSTDTIFAQYFNLYASALEIN